MCIFYNKAMFSKHCKSNNFIMGCIPFGECRAKTCSDGSPGTFVFDHCRYSGYVAEGLLALLPVPVRNLLPPETPFLVSLHDVGKVSPGFEGKYFIKLLRKYAPSWESLFINGDVTTDHATIGARSLQRRFGLLGDHPLISAVAAHHGFRPSSILATNDGPWQNERVELIRALAEEFGIAPESAAKASAPVDLLTGITCVADWIASDEEFFPPNEPPLSSDDGRKRAANALVQCGFVRPSFRRGLSFWDVFGFNPRPAQSAFLEEISSPGVYVLEAPMGMGKTEAALYAAYKLVEAGCHSGLYFALPTRLTSDRIHDRVRAFLQAVSIGGSAVKLAHGQAWLKEFESGAEGSDREAGTRPPPWFNPSKRGLLFPFAVGTIDQALLAVLNVKHSFVRSFGLAGKVVVLDEVHSYDAYTGTLLDELVKRLRELGCTVIILSATLTAARRAALFGSDAPAGDGYPLLAGVRAGTEERIVRSLEPPPSRSVRLRWIDASAMSPLEEAVAKARTGCNVLCIANTVATAQEWFRSLKATMAENEFPVGLLHSKFTGTDRERIEKDWMSKLGKPPKTGSDPRPCGSILVATQIVEQSVDIDADWMLSELAPADMLLQRLGRLWRHDREARPVSEPELAVVCARMPADDLSDLPSDTKELESFFGRGVWVYAPYILLRTFETLRDRKVVCVPDDIRPLLEIVYSETIPDSELHKSLYADMKAKAAKLRQLARMGEADSLPTRDDNEESAETRYNSRPTVSLLLVRDLDAAASRSAASATLLDGQSVSISLFQRNFKVTRALYVNLVQVAPNDTLREEKLNHRTEILSQHFFASETPLVCLWDLESGALRLQGSGADTGYRYTTELGAVRMRNEEASSSHNAGNADDPDFFFDNGNDW